jgi:MFS family permease
MWMQRIAVGWLTWQLTQSGMWLGIVAFAEFIPVVIVGPFAGAVADRMDRLAIVRISQSLSMVQAMALCLLTATGHITIWMLVALSAAQGILVAFNQPSRLALVSSLVSENDLAGAVAINSIGFNLARFVGPMLAGPAILLSGPAGAFFANAISYLPFLIVLSRIRPSIVPVEQRKRRTLAADIREGLAYTTKHSGIAVLLIMLTALGLGARPVNDLLPGFAVEIYRAGAGGLSVMASAIGAGAILGGLWVGHYAISKDLTRIIFASSLAGAVSAIGFAASGSLWLGAPLLVDLGFCSSTTGISIQTVIQLSTQPAMRGRVMGLYGVIFRGAPAIGALLSGYASVHLGLQGAVVLGAAVVIIAWIFLWARAADASVAGTDDRPEDRRH